MRTRTKTRSQPDEGPQSLEGNAASVADLVIGDDDMSGAGAAPSASYPAPDVSCPELEVARQRLAAVPEAFRTDELVAEVLRAAQAAAAHRLVTEAEQDNAATLAGTVTTFPLDITAAVAAQSALTALAAVRERLDHPFIITEVVEPIVADAAVALRSVVAPLAVTVPQYLRDRERHASLRTHPQRDIPAPVLTEADSDAVRVYERLIVDAAKFTDAVSAMLRDQAATGDVLGWLVSLGNYLDLAREMAGRVADVESRIRTANQWRESRGFVWQPPAGVSVDTVIAREATRQLCLIKP